MQRCATAEERPQAAAKPAAAPEGVGVNSGAAASLTKRDLP